MHWPDLTSIASCTDKPYTAKRLSVS